MSSRDQIVNRDLNPLLARLPEKFAKIEPHQMLAVRQILDAYRNGAEVVVLDAPTGSGKTLIAEVVRRMMAKQALYVCTDKGLQDQFCGDFEYAKLLKGRANYPTFSRADAFHPDRWEGNISCDDCTWTPANGVCKFCPNKKVCPYERAKAQALTADLAVLNTSYFLAEANNIGRFSKQQFVVVDEADELEQSIMNFVSVEVSERRLEKWGWDVPEKVTVKESYAEWLAEKVVAIDKIMKAVRGDSVAAEKERKFCARLQEQMRAVLKGLDSDAWVYTGRDRSNKRQANGASFRPARVDFLGDSLLWAHSDKWLLMSATVISSQELLDSLGCTKQAQLVRVASTFPIENRRVVVKPVASMAMKNREIAWPLVSQACVDIVNQEQGHRVLIHSVSYALTKVLVEALRKGTGRKVVSYTSAGERNRALASYRATAGAVMVAPSMERGVDLKDDDCRVQIIVKVPYPYLGDRQISTRLHSRGGKVWYTVNTIRLVVQMAGRATRHKEDWSRTYIVDSDFKNRLWNEGRSMFPSFFVEAIQWQ